MQKNKNTNWKVALSVLPVSGFLIVYWLVDIYGTHAEEFYSSAWVNFGYKEDSLFRASSAVKCHVTLHAFSLRMFSQAETSWLTVSGSINLRARPWHSVLSLQCSVSFHVLVYRGFQALLHSCGLPGPARRQSGGSPPQPCRSLSAGHLSLGCSWSLWLTQCRRWHMPLHYLKPLLCWPHMILQFVSVSE